MFRSSTFFTKLTKSSLAPLSDSPKRFWWYHWVCWTLSAVGIFCILLAHDHYTVDVVVAYFITTRLFWWYHTMANQRVRGIILREFIKNKSFSFYKRIRKINGYFCFFNNKCLFTRE